MQLIFKLMLWRVHLRIYESGSYVARWHPNRLPRIRAMPFIIFIFFASVVSFQSGRCINLSSGVSKTVHIDQSEYHFGTFLYPIGVNQYSVLPSSYIRSRMYFFQHGVGSIPASMYCYTLAKG